MQFRIKRSKADKYFSDFIRELADYTCERCKRSFERPSQLLHCSHFWSRRNKSVRFDRDNAASLCFYCHRYFTENPADHQYFFLKRLGQEKYDALCVRARQPAKFDEEAIAAGFKLALEMMKKDRKVMW